MASDYLHSIFSLQGKTAIITGGTGGIGSSLAMALAKAGASIISIELPNDPNSVNFANSIAEIGGSIRVFHCDLAKKEDLRACYASIWDVGIVPDILVNSAGIQRRNPCEDATDDDLDQLVAINMKATYVSCQEFGRKLLALNRPGKIINVCSVTAFLANKNTSIYSSTKGAVLQMTKAFSNEWASKGIQVNCISPGFMRTPLTEVYTKDPATNSYVLGRIPAARWGVPNDLDPAVLFLASPANTFISGESVAIDGGFCGK